MLPVDALAEVFAVGIDLVQDGIRVHLLTGCVNAYFEEG